MSYATIERQIRSLPEDCLEDVSRYIEFLIFKREQLRDNEQENDLERFFGSLTGLPDGMKFQREARNEWD